MDPNPQNLDLDPSISTPDFTTTVPVNLSQSSPLVFKAHAELLHLCVMDSMMPSPSRHLEGRYESPESSSVLLINGDNSVVTALTAATSSSTLAPPLSESEALSSIPLSETATTLLSGSQKTSNQSEPSSRSDNLSMMQQTKIFAKAPLLPSVPKGAWASPLKTASIFKSLAVPETGLCNQDEKQFSVLSDDALWPALSDGKQPRKQGKMPLKPAANQVLKSQKETNPEYPWAAKMKAVCNLRRVTTPVYMEDGTPKVCIPSHVLLEGLENQREYVVGQFYRCSAPSGGQVHAVATRIWGRNCRIHTRKLDESSFLFHIPHENTRKWVIERGIWHIDDCLMFVSPWSPSETITLPEIRTIPVWLTLKNIPYQLYSFKGINWIASGIGEPMLSNKPWLDPTQMGEAKILVEVKLDRPFPQRVALEDTSGAITMVDVVYTWLPPKCINCGQLGHKASRCLGLTHKPTEVATDSTTSSNLQVGIVSNPPDPSFTKLSVVHSSFEKVSVPAPVSTLVVPAVVPAIITDTETTSTSPPTSEIATPTTELVTPTTTTHPAPISAPFTTDCDAPSTQEIAVPTGQESQITPTTNIGNVPMLEDFSTDCTTPSNETQENNESLNEPNVELVVEAQVSNRFASLSTRELPPPPDLVEDGETESTQRSRGGRPLKPTQKVQEMQWITVGGRGSRGRGGRGGRGHIN